ncbi:MAG: hypothetical protein OXI39_04045 [Gemmatimonadota bacterium]|uniref:hypothetical protein n=1 Tax=Candidatus Palauibacter scopulicola TaxID=3056741 RepID=UPI00238573B7|nr:hypothetical protein [Candidatus Palauibacter scopulicola]MDE2662153.1 hypothetical protein [Candidatus Palauibacter scopulicola]
MNPISASLRSKGQRLLHRQCWNWGRDIVRREGNLLLEAGFLKRRPPEGEAGSSCYTLALPGGDSLVLWGFGLLYGTPQRGGVYLNRYQFRPAWLPSKTIPGQIWKPDMIPAGSAPPSLRVPLDLTVAAIRRVADYEEWALARCGLEYRRAVLRQWKGPSERLPPQELPQAWRTLADAIDGQPHPEPVERPNGTIHASDDRR